MRIALNIETIGARRGGAEKYAGTVARWLIGAGHEVHVFAREVDDGELPPGTPVHFVRLFCPMACGWLRAYLFARQSEQMMRDGRFDLIIGFNKVWYVHAYLAVGGAHPAALDCNSRRFRSPLVRAAWWGLKLVSPKQWVFRAIARRQFSGRHQPHVIAPARMVAEHFGQYHGVAPQRVAIVYNALESGASLPDPAAARDAFRRRHGLRPDDVTTLFVARNYVLKGLQPLLQAFAQVAKRQPTVQLVVCGSRRDNRFRRQAERHGVADRVRFLGFVDDVRECFAGCDIFAFPTFYDPCSLVVLEAMHAGLPVITTRQNGAAELVTEGVDGFVVDSPWAIPQLTERLTRLARDQDLRRNMGRHAQARVSECTVEARHHELLVALARAAHDRSAQPSLRNAA